jgi:zinc protease
VTAILSLHVGNGTEADAHPGLAGLAARVAGEGTATRTSKAIKEELRAIGGYLSVGSDSDATTVSAGALSEFAPRLLALMADVVARPSYPEKEVALAKENLVQEVRDQRSQPGFLGNERFLKAVFGSHPYGFVAPDEKSVAALQRADLAAFAARYYVPANAHLVVVGDFDAAAMSKEVDRAFASWKAGPKFEPALPAPPSRDKRQIYFVDRPGSVQSSIRMGNVTFPRRDEDYFVMRTANVIYGGSFYSRLTRNIREGKGYTYSPFSTLDTRAHSGYFAAAASVRNEVTGATILEMIYELDRMRVLPVTDEELAAAKSFSVGNFAIELASQSGLAGRLNTIYVYGLPRTFLEDFRGRIESITPAQIEVAAARYLDTYRQAIAIVGDWQKVKDQVMPFGTVTVYTPEGEIKKGVD